MKRNKIILSLLSISLAFGIGATVYVNNSVSEPKVAFATYTNGDGSTYYNGINESLEGESLRSALHSLNVSKRKSTVGYSGMGTTSSGQFKYTDYVPSSVKYDSNGQPYGDRIVSFYSGNSTTSFNREHVWPNSHGGNATENDIHMPRPTIPAENGSRGNSFYVEGKKSGTAGWDPAMEDFGEVSYRGDSARIIFYCMIAETRYQLIEADSHSTSNSNKDYMMGKLSDLIKWNINYPVQEREQRRNEGAEYLQGNRNPFIDHPEYACKIWGNTNATTKALCANATYPSIAHTAGIRIDDGYQVAETNSTAYTLKVGDSVNFLPFVDGAFNSSVSWSLSDYSVANSTYYSRGSYLNGVTITGQAEGVSTLTLTYTYDDNGQSRNAVAQVLITVNSTGGGSGTGGEDADDVENIKTATYKVSSSSAVTTSGTTPSGSSASYSQTYSTKGQITSGKNAILTLSGYNGKVITGITLNMKSNGSSGAGNFNAVAGATTLASTSGQFNSWYDNDSYGTSYRDINVSLTNDTHIIGSDETVTLTITGTTNSLYINSYTITYGDPSSGGGVDPTEPTLSSISVSDMTLAYTVDDTFSFDGVLKAHYSDGNIETVIPDSVSTPDMSTSGNKTITVTYSEGNITKTTSYIIFVSEKQLVLNSLELNGQTTSYYVGDKFSFTGTCTARYVDSTVSKNVTPTSVSSPDMTTSGNKTVTVTYTENGVSKSAQYTINVQAVTLTSIVLGGLTTEYYVGDSLVKPTVTANYNNGSNRVVTDEATFTGFDSSTATNSQTITVSFGGLSKTYTISISEKPVPSENGYIKVTSTSDVTAGDYLIVYEDDDKAFNGGLSTLDAINNTISIEIKNGVIESNATTNAAKFTLANYNNGFSIRSASGIYIDRSSNSNGMETSSSPAKNTITIANSSASIVGSGGASLRYNANTGQNRFRYYKDAGQDAIQLYKLNSSSVPVDEKVVTSITFSGAKTSYVQGDTFVKPTVTAHYDDESSAVVTTASFSGYNMQEVGNQTVTAYYTENGVTVSESYSINVAMNTTATTPLSSFYDGTITLATTYSGAKWYDIKGVVVGVDGYKYYIQEGEYGFCVYGTEAKHPAWYSDVSVGDYVLLHVKVYKYEGLVECDNYPTDSTVTKLGTHALPEANEYNSVSAFLQANQSTRVSLFNLGVDNTNISTINSFSGTSTEDQSFLAYDLNNTSSTVTIFIHKSVNSIAKTAIVEKLKTITKDDTVEFLRCVAAYHERNQISLSSADQIVIHSPSEDKLAAWGVNYLFIGDPAFDGDGTGACKTANYYKDAKSALFDLEDENPGIIETLQNDSTYASELARYLAWARACHDDTPFVDDYTFMNSAISNLSMDVRDNTVITIVAVIASITIFAFITLSITRKRKRY